MRFLANCPICEKTLIFETPDDFYGCRDYLFSNDCPYGKCITRERAVALTLFSIFPKPVLKEKVIFEASPVPRGLSLWLKENCDKYYQTGYFPEKPFGEYVNGLRNEDLENLTLEDETVDVWILLDILEHLFDPFKALNEIYRTLKPDGVCLFTVPTYPGQFESTQKAYRLPSGDIEIIGEPEYHGDPQHPESGSLVTWQYGYDLPLLISRKTNFEHIEVMRWQSKCFAVMGAMTEVYIMTKTHNIFKSNTEIEFRG